MLQQRLHGEAVANLPKGIARYEEGARREETCLGKPGAVVVETGKPDEFYAGLTDLVATGACGAVEEVTSPDDNLQAVFKYLVKS